MAKKKKKKYPKDRLFYSEIIISIIVLTIVFSLALFSHLNVKHTVIFNSNGGTAITLKKVNNNSTVKEPPTPTREGYEFLGWYLDDELYSFDTKITKNIELEAKWKEIITSEIESIKLYLSDFTIKPKQKLQLTPIIRPISAIDEKVYWHSSDSNVVEVDSTGNIETKSAGVATISVRTVAGLSDEVEIKVSNDAVNIKEVKFAEDVIDVNKGSTKLLIIDIFPINASNKNIVWSSDNTNIASIDILGNVTGKSVGIATVTAISLDGNKIAWCKVNVINE